MLREVVLDVLARDVMRRERAVGEPPVREAHGDVGDVGPNLLLTSRVPMLIYQKPRLGR